MIDGSPSRTALMVAAQRANHFLNAPEPKILRDSLAMQLSGFETPQAVSEYIEAVISQFTALSDRETAVLFLRRIEDSVCMRSRLVEGELEAALSLGLKQLVILGAGLDSTAYRLPELTKDLQVFEVDHPATQKWKRERLADIGVTIPDNLKFVEFDFEHQTLAYALTHGGVDKNKMSLFSWLGVQPYLTDESVTATIEVLAGFPSGSELVMDFVMPDYSGQGEIVEDGLDQLTAVVTKMGEPFISLYTEAEIGDKLKRSGFGCVDFYKAEALVKRFLNGNSEAYSVPNHTVALLSAIIR